jgi:hypothetical protein
LLALLLATMLPLAIWGAARWRRRTLRLNAYQLARARLDRLLAKPFPGPAQVDPFYVELSSIVRRYLEDRFELRAPELTTEEFLVAVGQAGALGRDNLSAVSREHQALLREFLRLADLVKFAGIQPSEEDIRQSIDTARRFLDETQQNAPLVVTSSLDPAPADAG